MQLLACSLEPTGEISGKGPYDGLTDAQCDALRAKADQFEKSGKPISEAPKEIQWIIARRKRGRTNGRALLIAVAL